MQPRPKPAVRRNRLEDKSKANGELKEAFRQLGDNLTALLRTGWQSEVRRRTQREIEEGFAELADQLQQAAEELSAGEETGRRLREDLESLQARVQVDRLESRVRGELLRVLTAINDDLERKRREWSQDTGEPGAENGAS